MNPTICQCCGADIEEHFQSLTTTTCQFCYEEFVNPQPCGPTEPQPPSPHPYPQTGTSAPVDKVGGGGFDL